VDVADRERKERDGEEEGRATRFEVKEEEEARQTERS
jgi:hypothetical protein